MRTMIVTLMLLASIAWPNQSHAWLGYFTVQATQSPATSEAVSISPDDDSDTISSVQSYAEIYEGGVRTGTSGAPCDKTRPTNNDDVTCIEKATDHSLTACNYCNGYGSTSGESWASSEYFGNLVDYKDSTGVDFKCDWGEPTE